MYKNKAILSLLLLLSFNPAHAEEDSNNGGYSYFRFGFEDVTYKENTREVKSSARALSPVLNSGGLNVINDSFDFSIDSLATFSPGKTDETWYWNGSKLRENKYQYVRAATNILLHYKMTPEWRLAIGPSFSYQTYKRFGQERNDAKNEDYHDFYQGTFEETSTDIFIDAGFIYDTGSLNNESPWQYQFRALVGAPIWSYTTNTAEHLGDLKFDESGYRANLETGIAYRVLKGVSLGVFASAGYEKRLSSNAEIIKVDGKRYRAVIPEADTLSYSAGLQLLWKL
ncbi:hypothetical protein [Veronia pacifica]|uniref:Outer membrane protein beta-barrel domain-containing protein n=1 Tax=Veronia pacifica TaxID=1080227 RepID=A0A1C3ECH0_9GAMM|nr:hypothetical protein [Veronia pacifica]ODA30884.1 hypothetical protein A8L45_18910 [Veronia pacifica]